MCSSSASGFPGILFFVFGLLILYFRFLVARGSPCIFNLPLATLTNTQNLPLNGAIACTGINPCSCNCTLESPRLRCVWSKPIFSKTCASLLFWNTFGLSGIHPFHSSESEAFMKLVKLQQHIKSFGI